MGLPRWLKQLGSLLGRSESITTALAVTSALASLSTAGCAGMPRNAQASEAADVGQVVDSVVVDSVVTPYSEKFVLTQADSIVIRCDTIKYRRSTVQRPSSSRGTGHQSHVSHASHSSHSSHSSGGWV
jgi:hypothetical protein